MDLTLLTGSYQSISSGGLGLFQALHLDLLGSGGAVCPATGAATDRVLAVSFHFKEVVPGQSFYNVAGTVVDFCHATQSARVVIGDRTHAIFHLDGTFLEHLAHKIIKMDDFKTEISKVLGVVSLKGIESLRAVEDYPLGARGADDFKIVRGQFFKGFHLTIPEHVVAAAVFIVTDYRFNSRTVENLNDVLANRKAVHTKVAKNNLKIGHAAHKEKGITLFGNLACFPGPVGFLLVDPLGLELHDGLEHAVMGIGWLGSELHGLLPQEAHKFREINT